MQMQSNINHSLYECCMVSFFFFFFCLFLKTFFFCMVSFFFFFFFAFCWQPFFIEVAFLKTQDNNQVPPLRFLPLKLETFLFFNNNNSSSQSTFWGIMMTLCDFWMLWRIISVLIFWSSDTILWSGIWSILFSMSRQSMDF